MLPVNIGLGQAYMPPTLGRFAPGAPLGGQLRGVGSSERSFAPRPGVFQLGGDASPAARAMQTAVEEAHADMVIHASQCMAGAASDAAAPEGGLRLIDNAQARAMDAIFRHAEDPARAEQIYAAGRYAARIGVEDLAVALSELRIHGDAPEECERLEKSLCELLVGDGLGDRSGFSAWHEGNCYDEVSLLKASINARLDALPGKPDIFESTMQRDVMPAIRNYLEARFGNFSYATWQKIDAAGGLISRAAAEAADRMTESLRNGGQGEGALRAKVNQWRLAQHWAELMRGVHAAPGSAPQAAQSGTTPLATPATGRRAAATAPALYSVKQEANPVFKPIIVIGSRDVDGTLNRIMEEQGREATATAREEGSSLPPSPLPSQTARRSATGGVGDVAMDWLSPPQDRSESPQARPPMTAGQPAADVPDGRSGTPETRAGLADGNSVLQLRPSVQALRTRIPVPPPLPQSGSTPSSPVAATTTSPPSTATSPASPASETSGTSSLEEAGTDQDVTLHNSRDRSLSPIQQLIRKFEDAGIGVQAPARGSEHIGSLLHSVGNRISTTEWPLLRSVSDGDAGQRDPGATGSRGSLDSVASGSSGRASPTDGRAPSPSREDYARLAGGGSGAAPYRPLSTTGRAIQVGPAFGNGGARK